MRVLRPVVLILAAVVFIVVPTAFFHDGHSLCLFKNFFGIDCPGCGMTRALSSLGHGDYLAALKFNSSVLVVGPLLLFLFLRICLEDLVEIINIFRYGRFGG